MAPLEQEVGVLRWRGRSVDVRGEADAILLAAHLRQATQCRDGTIQVIEKTETMHDVEGASASV